MRTDAAEVEEKLTSPCNIKVHGAMCTELVKLVDRVEQIFPEIEAARPRCSSGIESLCLLNSAIGKAKLLILDCCESSKLYLALTGSTILSRCQKTKSLLEQSLSQIQSVVPVILASEILQIIGELRGTKLSLDPLEEEAGKAIRALLEGYRTGNRSEQESGIDWILIAAQKLQITSQRAIVIEKRSIKKLLSQLKDGNNKQQKKQILSFLLDLLTKHGKSITSLQTEIDNTLQSQDYKPRKVDFVVDREKMSGVLPKDFKSLMSDPFVQLSNEVNTWENSSSSVNSLSSMYSLQLPVDYSNISLSSLDNSRVVEDSREFDVEFPREIDDSLPWEVQCKLIDDLLNRLKDDNRACKTISCGNLVESLVKFLKVAWSMNDVKAQRIGCMLLLTLVSKCRSIEHLSKEAYQLIAEFLESEVIEEALAITEELSSHKNCQSEIAFSGSLTHIFKILDTQIKEIQTPALRILYNLTSTRTIRSLIGASDLIPKLVTLSEEDSLSRYCIAILTNLCVHQDNKSIIAETNGCIPFITRALDSESYEEQEQALEILLSLCSQSIQYCRLVMDEGVIPSVFSISIRGNEKGKAKAHEMLRLLRDTDLEEYVEESVAPVHDIPKDSNSLHVEKKTSSRTSRIFSKISLISKGPLAQKRKV